MKKLKQNQMIICNNKRFSEKNMRGITLIALVVTIVVLIILATISINAVVGENGLIRKAQEAKELYDNSTIAEEEAMNTLMEQYDNAIKEPPTYEDDTLPVVPNVTAGMTKVKIIGTEGIELVGEN